MIVSRVELSAEERKEVSELQSVCQAFDGPLAPLQMDHSLNFHRELPSWFLYHAGTRLLGVLALFGPLSTELEISALVLPELRRRGIFTGLLAKAKTLARSYGIEGLLGVVDRRSESGQSAAKAAGCALSHTEYAMRLPGEVSLPEAIPIELREAREEDLPEMIPLSVAAFGDSAEEAESLFRANREAPDREQYLAIVEGRVVGVCSIAYDEGDASINGLGVDPAVEGRGFGRAIVTELVARLREAGAGIVLDVDSTNDRAYRLYSSLGFVEESVIDYFVLKA